MTSVPESLKKLIDNIPLVVHDLDEAFNKTQDFNERCDLRLYIKTLLDLQAVNTKYPPMANKRMAARNGLGLGDGLGDGGPIQGNIYPPAPIQYGAVANQEPPRPEALPAPEPDNRVYPVPGVV